DLVAVGDPESGGVVAEVVCVCRLSGAGAGRSTLGAGAAPAATRAPPRRPGAPLPHGGGGGPAGPAPRSLVIVQLPPPVGLAIFRTNVDISDPCSTAGGPRLRPGQHRTPTPAQGAGPSHAAGLVPRILSHLSSLIMYRPTIYLATLLLAALISLAPTPSPRGPRAPDPPPSLLPHPVPSYDLPRYPPPGGPHLPGPHGLRAVRRGLPQHHPRRQRVRRLRPGPRRAAGAPAGRAALRRP